ncbi:M1 family metallopeptidase [uncultured Sphingomonas sp.]|uniref:M1 family metallopeptidase n=1 Tax=uncultured Sphingomonas sp. TaxID=158754 RepID=UPI00260CEB5A|nr:M1 family metallopeptidase [uncultured Sphingomonas sp.]
MPRLVATLLSLPLLALAPPPKGSPPLTDQTQRSGGPLLREQTALRFDHADLSFEVLPERQALNGVATLTFTARAPLARLLIDLDHNLPVSAISIDGRPLARAAWTNPDGRLTVTLPNPLAAGRQVTVRISYGGTPHVAVNAPWDDGMVWSKTPDGRTWFATTAEGYGCDLFWPCLDFPTGEPASVDLHITVPAGLKAPSNGRLLGIDRLPDDRTRWNWRARQPNTYAIALNVGPYEEISGTYKSRYGNTIPMSYWYLPGEKAKAEALFAEFAPTLDFFEATVGPYPFGDEKLGVVETPHKGMEHQTINAYGNNYAKAPEGFDWLFHHELSHEWFGNQLTAGNWDDYWLHEGFGSYMQPLYGRWREGEARYHVMLDAQRNQIANDFPVVRDKVLTEEEVYEPKLGGPGTDIYYKASWMLHSLRWLIGDAAFFKAMRLEVYGRDDPKPGNFRPRFGSTAEYQRIVNQVTDKNYDWFFNAYLRQATLPELVATPLPGNRTELRWKVPGGLTFPMPIEVSLNGRTRRLAMTNGAAIIDTPPGAHLVIDPEARVLRRNPAIEAFRNWSNQQRSRK